MKKILILANHFITLYSFRKELITRLVDDGNEVHLSIPDDYENSFFLDIGCKIHSVKLERHGTNPISDFGLFHSYFKLIKELKPDMVFSYTIKPNIYGGMACELLGIPYVANITGLGTAVENSGLLQKITVMLYKLAFTKIQTVFLQNNENMRFFIDNQIALGKHKLLPGSGVNLEKFSYCEYPKDDVINFVFISRIMREKGIDQYLDAATEIRSKYPNSRFHVCGFCEQEYENKLKELEKKNIITYHGMVKDVRSIIKDMHCIVHPTYYPEGLSNVLLEASACGRPIITTNRSGCREVIDDLKNGYICEQKSSADLIDKIDKFINLSYDEKRNMGIYGRKKVEKGFDRQIVINEYINELCKSNSREVTYV